MKLIRTRWADDWKRKWRVLEYLKGRVEWTESIQQKEKEDHKRWICKIDAEWSILEFLFVVITEIFNNISSINTWKYECRQYKLRLHLIIWASTVKFSSKSKPGCPIWPARSSLGDEINLLLTYPHIWYPATKNWRINSTNQVVGQEVPFLPAH